MGIEVEIKKGGLGRQSTDTDTWGGLYVEVDALPVGWTANEVKRIFRPEDLESYGIKATAVSNYYKLVYWHVSEAFRLAPNCTLYVQLSLTATGAYATILNAFKAAENRLRRFAIVKTSTQLAAAEGTNLNAALETLFTGSMQPARAVLTCKKDTEGDLPDFSALANYRVLIDISNDITTGGLAKAIFDSAIGMCGAGGTVLGQLLRLKVHQQISWNSYPVNSGERWVTLGDINGASVETLTETAKDAYGDDGLVLITRTLRDVDAYFRSARTAGAAGDDYDVVNNGCVIDKAIVLAYDGMKKNLNGPVYTDLSGKISPETIVRFENGAYSQINTNMVIGRTGDNIELVVDPATGSLPTDSVYIDPNQDVKTTGKIVTQIRLRPVGAANDILIQIGLIL